MSITHEGVRQTAVNAAKLTMLGYVSLMHWPLLVVPVLLLLVLQPVLLEGAPPAQG